MGSDSNTLENEILMLPAEECDELHILSGYARSSMLKRHIDMLDEKFGTAGRVKIELIAGMAPKEGLSVVDHKGFKEIVSTRQEVMCSYIMANRNPVHVKLYIWLRRGSPKIAFIGSANYTQNAFFGGQIEAMINCDPIEAEKYYQSFSGDTAYCNHDEIEDMVMIVNAKRALRKKIEEATDKERINTESEKTIRLSLLMENGEIGKRSSLNWGQRGNRNPDEAYISMPSKIAKSGFFPERGTIITIMTDDGMIMFCKMAGNNKKGGPIPKQIETTNDNSELGRYFRKRLGVQSGAFVEKEDLLRYGRTDVTFVNLEDGTYYLDFKRPKKGTERIEKA